MLKLKTFEVDPHSSVSDFLRKTIPFYQEDCEYTDKQKPSLLRAQLQDSLSITC